MQYLNKFDQTNNMIKKIKFLNLLVYLLFLIIIGRLFYMQIINNNDSIELVSEPYGQSDNMVINLYGKTNVLSDYNKKKRTI